MEFYLELGLDGLHTNDIPDLMAVLGSARFRGQVRLATRADDAFEVNARPYVPRYLGNKKTKELHDLDNEQDFCQIDEIKHPRPFAFVSAARSQSYEGCGWCNLAYHTR